MKVSPRIMTKIKRSSLIGYSLLLSFFVLVVPAYSFESGSDGSFGAIDILVDTTIALPPDGIIKATSVDVADGATLSFDRNEFNTPVYLLATGNVTIAGTIDVSGNPGTELLAGLSGPGGFDGGKPGSLGVPAGDGQGPGGGKAGEMNGSAAGVGPGGYGTRANSSASLGKGETYGSALLLPIIGGSGGGGGEGSPGLGGSGGGGAIVIASDTQIEISSTGSVFADGGPVVQTGVFSGGSGGAVRLVAPKVLGSGEVRCMDLGINGFLANGQFAGYGRIRVDTLDSTELEITFDPVGLTTVGPNLVVFPPLLPRLDITEAAGQTVALDTPSPVLVDLDFNADPNQTITVRAENFLKVVNFALVLQPVNGSRTIIEESIDNTEGTPVIKEVDVVLPLNAQTEIFVWTIPDP